MQEISGESIVAIDLDPTLPKLDERRILMDEILDAFSTILQF
jgi:hypothetical protein